MSSALPRPKPHPRPRLKQRMIGLGIAIFICVILPLIAMWFFVCQPSLARNQPSTASVDPVMLESHVRMLSETFVPRDFANRKNLNSVADFVASKFDEAGSRTERQSFREGGIFEFQNISGFFGPNEASLPRVIIGAHYDAYEDFPGADDNASGVAGLIELAGLLGKIDPADFALPVELVSWPLEEPPYFRSDGMGSAKHASALKKAGVNVQLMVSLEMIGYFADERSSQSYPMPLLHLFYPGRGNFLAIASDLHNREVIAKAKAAMRGASPLPIHSIAAPRNLPGIDFSDHLNYWRQGYPAIMLTDTAFYRNDRYHPKRDTADTLDYERMAQVVVATYELVRAQAIKN